MGIKLKKVYYAGWLRSHDNLYYATYPTLIFHSLFILKAMGARAPWLMPTMHFPFACQTLLFLEAIHACMCLEMITC